MYDTWVGPKMDAFISCLINANVLINHDTFWHPIFWTNTDGFHIFLELKYWGCSENGVFKCIYHLVI